MSSGPHPSRVILETCYAVGHTTRRAVQVDTPTCGQVYGPRGGRMVPGGRVQDLTISTAKVGMSPQLVANECVCPSQKHDKRSVEEKSP